MKNRNPQVQQKVDLSPVNIAFPAAIMKISAQAEKIDRLHNKLDDLCLRNLDLEESCMRVHQLEMELGGSQANLRRSQQDYETVVKQLTKIQEQCKAEGESARFQKETVRLAQIEMDKLRAAKVNDEHLARKLIELHGENTKYQEQVTRLLAEQVDYDCQKTGTGEQGSLCGGCLSCLLKQRDNLIENTDKSLEQTIKNLKEVEAQVCELGHITTEKNKRIFQLELQLLNIPWWKKLFNAYK